jgi:hypothetical protein
MESSRRPDEQKKRKAQTHRQARALGATDQIWGASEWKTS